MLDTIFGLFTSFNPIIAGVMLGAGAYFALRHHGASQRGAVTARARRRTTSEGSRAPRVS